MNVHGVWCAECEHKIDCELMAIDAAYYNVAGQNIKLANIAIFITKRVKIDMFEVCTEAGN